MRLLMWLGFPIAGAALGVLLKMVAAWVVGLEWAPMQGPFKLLESLDPPWDVVAPVKRRWWRATGE